MLDYSLSNTYTHGNTFNKLLLQFMKFTTTVTQKGQITLPKDFRKKIGVKPYDKVELELMDGKLKISRMMDVLDLSEIVKAIPGKTALDARKTMEKDYSRE